MSRRSGSNAVFSSRDSAFFVLGAILNFSIQCVYSMFIHTLDLSFSDLALDVILRFSFVFAATVQEFILVVLSYFPFRCNMCRRVEVDAESIRNLFHVHSVGFVQCGSEG